MTLKKKQETTEFFTEAFHKVFQEFLLPVIENIDRRLEKIEDNVNSFEGGIATKADIDRLERKYFAEESRLDRHGVVLEKHDKEINKLKKATLS